MLFDFCFPPSSSYEAYSQNIPSYDDSICFQFLMSVPQVDHCSLCEPVWPLTKHHLGKPPITTGNLYEIL